MAVNDSIHIYTWRVASRTCERVNMGQVINLQLSLWIIIPLRIFAIVSSSCRNHESTTVILALRAQWWNWKKRDLRWRFFVAYVALALYNVSAKWQVSQETRKRRKSQWYDMSASRKFILREKKRSAWCLIKERSLRLLVEQDFWLNHQEIRRLLQEVAMFLPRRQEPEQYRQS